MFVESRLQCLYSLQTFVAGFDNVDAHIGGDELHRRCYDELMPKWSKWSKHDIPLERTCLRGPEKHAALAGFDRKEPAQQRDVIWNFFLKARGKSVTFKTGEITLVLEILLKDLNKAMKRKELLDSPDANSDDCNSSGSDSFRVSLSHQYYCATVWKHYSYCHSVITLQSSTQNLLYRVHKQLSTPSQRQYPTEWKGTQMLQSKEALPLQLASNAHSRQR